MSQKNKNINIIIILVLTELSLTGCMKYPQFREDRKTIYDIVTDRNTLKQSKHHVTIQDLGEATHVFSPISVQSCQNGQLLYKIETKCSALGCWDQRVRKMETITPLQHVYIRKVKIQNNTDHILRLNKADAVMIDGAGAEHSFSDHSDLAEYIYNHRPCSSTSALMQSVKRIKLFSNTMRIRPNRDKILYIAFPNINTKIDGDWSLEFIDIPVESDPAGNVTRAVSFDFPFTVNANKYIIRYQKNGFIKPWFEVERNRLN